MIASTPAPVTASCSPSRTHESPEDERWKSRGHVGERRSGQRACLRVGGAEAQPACSASIDDATALIRQMGAEVTAARRVVIQTRARALSRN
jgi:hypothetical protein